MVMLLNCHFPCFNYSTNWIDLCKSVELAKQVVIIKLIRCKNQTLDGSHSIQMEAVKEAQAEK